MHVSMYVCMYVCYAGHSAGVFLLSNPSAKLISFDLGTLAWTKPQVEYLQRLFPNRFTFVEGNSQVAIKEYATKNPDIKCDLWSIDGGSHIHTYIHIYIHTRTIYLLSNCSRNSSLLDLHSLKHTYIHSYIHT